MGEYSEDVAPLVSSIDSFSNNIAASNLDKKNREWAAEQAQNNRDFQLQMYERQLDDNIAWRQHAEEYNSPSAQMQRYRDAGINPMYIVSQGAGGNIVQTPMQANGSGYGSSVGVPTNNARRFGMMEGLRASAQLRISAAEENLLTSQARVYQEQAKGIELDNAKKEVESGYWASNAYQTSRHLIKMNQLNDSQRSMMKKQEQEIDAHIDEIQSKINLNKVAVANQLAQMQHQLWYTSFMQSLAPLEQERLQLAVDELRATANIKQFQDKMKKWTYWTDFGTQVVGSISQVLGSIKGLSFAPVNSVNHSFSKRVGNEIQSPESMMGTYDIDY